MTQSPAGKAEDGRNANDHRRFAIGARRNLTRGHNSGMSERAHGLRRGGLWAAGLAAVVAFAVLAGRFWHPYYGFTRFIQLDEADARSGLHEIRDNPVFVYDGFNGYDGAAYAQIAFHPLLDSPELQPALGNVPYRARRILGSALAWLLAAGDPARIAGTYAALNVGVWFVLAALLWRVLPVTDARSWCAWAGLMFSAGTLHSVRLALTDLLAATLVVASIWFGERGRWRGGVSLLATAGLARETALAAVVGLWRDSGKARRSWAADVAGTVVVCLPLFAWVAYVRWKAGSAAQGFGNFTWPIIGWVDKWVEAAHEMAGPAEFRWLASTTFLALVGLTVQATYLLRRRAGGDPWWRVGIAGVGMMALLGTSVWEGHPGAATRVLLPMSAAFAVFAVRTRAGWGWVLGGGLTVFSGVLALWHVPQSPREIAAGRFTAGAYVVRIEQGWYGVERVANHTWAWAAQRAQVSGELAPRQAQQVEVRLKLRAAAPRELEIRGDDRTLWRGRVGEQVETIAVPVPVDARGRFRLEFRTDAVPVRENANADARGLGFALYGVALR